MNTDGFKIVVFHRPTVQKFKRPTMVGSERPAASLQEVEKLLSDKSRFLILPYNTKREKASRTQMIGMIKKNGEKKDGITTRGTIQVEIGGVRSWPDAHTRSHVHTQLDDSDRFSDRFN